MLSISFWYISEGERERGRGERELEKGREKAIFTFPSSLFLTL